MSWFGFEKRWLLEVFATLLPSGAAERLPIGAADVPMGRFVDDLLQRAPFRFTFGLRACTWLLIALPLFISGSPRTFWGLSRERRLRLFERMRHSKLYLLREIPMLFKMVACFGFCGLPEVRAAVGQDRTDPAPPFWTRGESA